MSNFNRSNFQAHPFHLVSPSPWPLYTSISLLTLTTSAVLSFHGFDYAENNLILSIISLVLSMSLWFRDIIAEGTYMGNHTLAVQRGLNIGVGLFIVSEALFFLAIFWAFFHNNSTLWIRAKLRGSPKTLITKLHKEIFKVVPLMTGNIVTSLEIFGVNQRMGDRGSKSDSHISVKEQRVDGSSVFEKYCKVYSKYQGNLVFIHFIKYVNTIFKSIQQLYTNSLFYSKFPIPLSYSQTMSFNSCASNNNLNPSYVTGFTDGGGCFYISVSANPKYKTGYRIKAIFHIGLHIRDIFLLEQIQLFFGVGKITKLGEETVQFRVTGLKDLGILIKHFDKYPLITHKQSDYLLWKKVVYLMEQETHLTIEGLNQIISIKAVLNKQKISCDLNKSFPNIDPISRSIVKNTAIKNQESKIKNLHWLAGFTDAEGCFFVALKKSPASKLGETVWLRFILTQQDRDKDLLKSLISTLNCGRYISKPGYGEFIVEKFRDVNDKVIPIFEEFKLHGVKSKNFEDFKKVALLIKNKVHLTQEGLDAIKVIKGKMNKNRVY